MQAPNTEPDTMPAPMLRPRLRFITCGSVDDGKSTLIGRLLYESGAVFEDHLAEATGSAGGALDLSFLVDGLKAEREQGITIDVAYRYFTTPRRSFLIADAPGHEQYTRNQAAAASRTDLAVVLVSAPDGVQPQTRRHMAIAALFGVRDVVLAINKMDLVDYAEQVYLALTAQLRDLAASLGLAVVASIPLSARLGDNVVTKSAAMPWYGGQALLDALEGFEARSDAAQPALLPIAHTGRLTGGGRVSYGELVAGALRVGDTLKTDTAQEARITGLWVAGDVAEAASAGDAIAVQLSPELDLGRGALLGAPERPMQQVTQIRARFVWLASEQLQTGRSYDMQLACSQTSASISRIEGRLDLNAAALAPLDMNAGPNDIVVARLNLARPVVALPFEQSRTLGAFILVERASRRTVGAGVVLSIERSSGDTPWQAMKITHADRAQAMGQTPFVVWLTGLSGAGKSTIADLLDRRLHAAGRHAVVLDGDNLRHGLNADLGFTEEDRRENIRRVGHVAGLMADAGLIAIVSLISPYEQDRQRAKAVIGADRFLEVFVDAPIDVCADRDPKGMYARARAGTLQRFTGVASGYEPPAQPDLHLHTDRISPEQAVESILAALRDKRAGV